MTPPIAFIPSKTQLTRRSQFSPWYIIRQTPERIATSAFMRSLVSKLIHNNAVTYGPRHLPFVALTFDDGPHPHWTPKVLDILAQHSAAATFFIVASSAEKHPHLFRHIIAEGHEIALHSYQHTRDIVRNPTMFRDDLQKALSTIVEITRTRPVFFRYPYGISSRRTDQIVDALGLRRVYWSYSAGDSYLPASNEIAHRATMLMRPGSIVLLHDCLADGTKAPPPYRPDRTELLKALPLILAHADSLGLRPVTLSRMLPPPDHELYCLPVSP